MSGRPPTGEIALIWAQARDGVIGQDGSIPWHLPEDLAHFKALTTGSAVVMGRRTWDSLPERFRPLPGRRNIVVSRDPGWTAGDQCVEVAPSIPAAIELIADDPAWIIGGGEIYRQIMPLASRLEVTEIDTTVAGDTIAPIVDESWHEEGDAEWHASGTGLRYRFRTYRRDR